MSGQLRQNARCWLCGRVGYFNLTHYVINDIFMECILCTEQINKGPTEEDRRIYAAFKDRVNALSEVR